MEHDLGPTCACSLPLDPIWFRQAQQTSCAEWNCPVWCGRVVSTVRVPTFGIDIRLLALVADTMWSVPVAVFRRVAGGLPRLDWRHRSGQHRIVGEVLCGDRTILVTDIDKRDKICEIRQDGPSGRD